MCRFQGGIFAVLLSMAAGCGGARIVEPAVEFTVVPEAGPGGPAKLERIAGRVKGMTKGQRVVLYARSGTWWVQPFANKPFTAIGEDSTWETTTHLGTDYAALLVEPGYKPARTTDVLPGRGNGVVALTILEGRPSAGEAGKTPKHLRFSGYEWEVRQLPSDSGGVMHVNSAANAWTDDEGALHLRIAKEAQGWTCAEVKMFRSLGYGTYSFHVRPMPPLEPGTVLGMFTWDDLEAGQNHREIDVELSQWGDPASRNAQFVVQPYYIPANSFRFHAPPGALTHSFRWEPGRVTFKTARAGHVIAEHVFTSGIPFPGGETVHLNLYIYGKSRTPQQKGVEVVIDKFEFLP